MHWLIESLRQRPEIAVFLVLALGYGLGGLRLGPFKVGPILGVLFAGIAVGQLNIPVSETLKNAFLCSSCSRSAIEPAPSFRQSPGDWSPSSCTCSARMRDCVRSIADRGSAIGLRCWHLCRPSGRSHDRLRGLWGSR